MSISEKHYVNLQRSITPSIYPYDSEHFILALSLKPLHHLLYPNLSTMITALKWNIHCCDSTYPSFVIVSTNCIVSYSPSPLCTAVQYSIFTSYDTAHHVTRSSLYHAMLSQRCCCLHNTSDYPALVTVLEESRHNLQTGDTVVLTEVLGLEQLNGEN